MFSKEGAQLRSRLCLFQTNDLPSLLWYMYPKHPGTGIGYTYLGILYCALYLIPSRPAVRYLERGLFLSSFSLPPSSFLLPPCSLLLAPCSANLCPIPSMPCYAIALPLPYCIPTQCIPHLLPQVHHLPPMCPSQTPRLPAGPQAHAHFVMEPTRNSPRHVSWPWPGNGAIEYILPSCWPNAWNTSAVVSVVFPFQA